MNDQQAFKNFMYDEKVCVLSVLINSNTLHAAAMHFSIDDQALALIFSADITQEKYKGIVNFGTCPAAVVVGISEEKWITCQLSGHLEVTSPEEQSRLKKIHYSRIPSDAAFEMDKNTIFLRFTPSSGKITDYNGDEPVIIALI